jgi:2-iminobutanoate/2-iminopropanoate deaminase
VNDIYALYFSKPFPARSCVEVNALPKGALIEVELVAEVG